VTGSWFHVKQLYANPIDNLIGNVRVEIRIYIRCLKKQMNELFYYEWRTGSGRKKKVKILLSIINNKKAKEGNSCLVKLRTLDVLLMESKVNVCRSYLSFSGGRLKLSSMTSLQV